MAALAKGMMMAERDRSFVASLERGLRVITAFDWESPVLSVSATAKRANMSRAAARRFLITLEQIGLVGSDDRQHYHLTPKVLSLGYSYLSSLRLDQHTIPALTKVMHKIGASCSMAVLSDTEIVYVVRVDKPTSFHISIRVGERLPAYSTALGRVLLAGRPDAEVSSIIDRSDRRKATEDTVIDPTRLIEVIRQIREQGWACVVNQQLQGWTSVAVPVCNSKGQTVAAINASAINQSSQATFIEATLPPLREAAAEIEWAIKSTDAVLAIPT
jgi:IclR family pca regulon transcriptional regulator